MTKLRLPATVSVTGTIAEIKTLEGAAYEVLRRDTTVLTIVDFNDQLHTVWVSNAQVAEYGLEAKMFPGNIVTVQLNQNVKDETFYIDADGDEQPHEETFESFVGMINAQAIQLHMKGVPEFMITALEADRNKREASVAKPIVKFHASKATAKSQEEIDAQINNLLIKLESTTNPVLKANLELRLKQLGYESVDVDALQAEYDDEATTKARKTAIKAELKKAGVTI